jgi:hypothetical protein
MAWRSYFLEFCEAKLRKVKLRSSLTRARDRSGIFAEQKLERIARFFAPLRGAKNAPKKTGILSENRRAALANGLKRRSYDEYKSCGF